MGSYWTPADPRSYGPLQYRNVAGLPDRSNAGTVLLVGVLENPTGVVPAEAARVAPPVSYCRYTGGLIEYFIPAPTLQVRLSSSPIPLSPPYGGRPSVCPDGSIPPA